MIKNLIIVESPAKAKTIKGYLGKDFSVQSSYGHVRDLAKKEMGIDIVQDFAPNYVVIEDKKKVIQALKKSSQQAVAVYLATDDDREGEAISWHLAEALQLQQPQRIVFHEITKKAIQEALAHPRTLNMELVKAQQARRILDRIVGFEISPVLWQKIKGGLSAGRVQSVAVRLIVERERSIKAFLPESFFSVKAALIDKTGQTLQARLSARLPKEADARDFLSHCATANFSVDTVEKKAVKRHPLPPFTTSTLQQEASVVLGFSVSKTMLLAQHLYEAGRISYMRTDSVHLSEDALASAAQTIKDRFGEKYPHRRQYKTRIRSAQEAHEAIRPTDFGIDTWTGEQGESKLYNLIWRRALASQMAAAEIDRTLLHITISKSDRSLLATGEILRFDGFLRLYGDPKSDNAEENSARLPDLKAGDALTLSHMSAAEGFTKPAPRYTEATLVRELEEKGIGRPSTYAPTISTIQKRAYVQKESRQGEPRDCIKWTLKGGESAPTRQKLQVNVGVEKDKLFPTDIGILVNDFLTQHFEEVVGYSFTAQIEEQLDKIANGKEKWQEMLRHFYDTFHPRVEKSQSLDRNEVSKQRQLGKDPKTNKEVYVLMGRYGPYVQLGEFVEDAEKPPRASLPKGQFMEDITLQDAMELFKLPRKVGTYEDNEMIANQGRYGPYIHHKKKFYSLRDQDPIKIDQADAIALIEAAREVEKNRVIKTFSEDKTVQVLNGRYGPYIKFGDKNIRIPKSRDPVGLTYSDCKTLMENAQKNAHTTKPTKRLR